VATGQPNPEKVTPDEEMEPSGRRELFFSTEDWGGEHGSFEPACSFDSITCLPGTKRREHGSLRERGPGWMPPSAGPGTSINRKMNRDVNVDWGNCFGIVEPGIDNDISTR
jgi:hypothetical protein